MIKNKLIAQSLKTPDSKRELNVNMFSIVAKKYDIVTRVLSFGSDAAWKKTMVEQLPNIEAPLCLDLACGTGDICQLLAMRYSRAKIIGVDITPAMLDLAEANNPEKNISFFEADMASPPVENQSVDIITGGYALRNAPDLDQLLNTVWDKLKPGGVARFLDFAKSDQSGVQSWQMRLLTIWTGLWGIILHANPAVYNYIPASLKAFPTENELKEKVKKLGFADYRAKNYLKGFVSEISFTKPLA